MKPAETTIDTGSLLTMRFDLSEVKGAIEAAPDFPNKDKALWLVESAIVKLRIATDGPVYAERDRLANEAQS
ncbi:MAG: hypothetical protein ACOYOQ_00425 [Microthrixaceae bacterium]